MTEKHALQALLDDAGCETREYSGRGMYGRSCLGVDVPSFASFLALYTRALQEGAPKNEEWWDDITVAMSDARTDSMGMNIIVYFPGTHYTAEKFDSHDEDDGY